jgi:hypothetical protein
MMTEMSYNELRSWASENDVDVSASPSKDELLEAYNDSEDSGNTERTGYAERITG